MSIISCHKTWSKKSDSICFLYSTTSHHFLLCMISEAYTNSYMPFPSSFNFSRRKILLHFPFGCIQSPFICGWKCVQPSSLFVFFFSTALSRNNNGHAKFVSTVVTKHWCARCSLMIILFLSPVGFFSILSLQSRQYCTNRVMSQC